MDVNKMLLKFIITPHPEIASDVRDKALKDKIVDTLGAGQTLKALGRTDEEQRFLST